MHFLFFSCLFFLTLLDVFIWYYSFIRLPSWALINVLYEVSMWYPISSAHPNQYTHLFAAVVLSHLSMRFKCTLCSILFKKNMIEGYCNLLKKLPMKFSILSILNLINRAHFKMLHYCVFFSLHKIERWMLLLK